MREIRQRIVRYLLKRKSATAKDLAEYLSRATSVSFTEAQLTAQLDTLHRLGLLDKSDAGMTLDRSLARIKPEGLAILVDALPGTSWISTGRIDVVSVGERRCWREDSCSTQAGGRR